MNQKLIGNDTKMTFDAAFDPSPEASALFREPEKVIVEVGGKRFLCKMEAGALEPNEDGEGSTMAVRLTKIRELP